jgi:hypothetical protein
LHLSMTSFVSLQLRAAFLRAAAYLVLVM